MQIHHEERSRGVERRIFWGEREKRSAVINLSLLERAWQHPPSSSSWITRKVSAPHSASLLWDLGLDVFYYFYSSRASTYSRKTACLNSRNPLGYYGNGGLRSIQSLPMFLTVFHPQAKKKGRKAERCVGVGPLSSRTEGQWVGRAAGHSKQKLVFKLSFIFLLYKTSFINLEWCFQGVLMETETFSSWPWRSGLFYFILLRISHFLCYPKQHLAYIS